MDKKYGLQPVKVKPPQQKLRRPPVAKPTTFLADNDDEDNVEREISRQADKYKSLQNQAVFDYDEMMNQKADRHHAHDKPEKKSQYAEELLEGKKRRDRDREAAQERKLAKEREREVPRFADKDKFVTKAYRRKLEEKAAWEEQERRRELRKARDVVTNKKDMSEFYFNIDNNESLGGGKPKKNMIESETDSTNGLQINYRIYQNKEESKKVVADSGCQELAMEKPVAAERQDKDHHHKRSADVLAGAQAHFFGS